MNFASHVVLPALALIVFPTSVFSDTLDVWIGSGGPEGVFRCTLNTDTGKLSKPEKMNTLGSSGFLAVSGDGKTLYATAKDGKENGVASYQIQMKGKQRVLVKNGFAATGDGGATCVAIDHTGQFLFSAQYGGGSTCVYRLDKTGAVISRIQKIEHGPGSGVIPSRQKTAHPHWVGVTPDNQFLCVPDLGKDSVVVYQFDHASGMLNKHTEVPCPPGSGPRHMKFDRSNQFALVLNELTLSVSVFNWNKQDGTFSSVSTMTALPQSERDSRKHSAAEIRTHPNGKWIYTSNRGHDSITVFHFDAAEGKLEFVQREPVRGSWPRNFNLDPSGQWLIAAGQKSNTIALFKVDQETGKLEFTRTIFNVPNPICVEFGN